MRRVAVSAVCTTFLASLATAQVPSGPEFQISSATAGQPQACDVSSDREGDFVAVWSENNPPGGHRIAARRYEVLGASLGSEFIVDNQCCQAAGSPAVASGRVGPPTFMVVWHTTLFDSDTGILARTFDGDTGAPMSGNVLVNTEVAGPQTEPDVAGNGDRRFVVVWTSYGQDGSVDGVFGQRLNDIAMPFGPEFRVNTYTPDNQRHPAVASSFGGDFVVVWESHNQDAAGGPGIFGQRFDGNGGMPLGPEFAVNASVVGNQAEPAVATDGGGNFVVVWMSTHPTLTSYDIFGQRFDANGNLLGGEFRVNSYTTGDQRDPAVAADPNGNFVVVWHSYQDGSSLGTFGQRYDSSGVPRGGEFRVNTWTTSAQFRPAVSASDGNFVVAWVSAGQVNSADIFGQRFGGLFTGPSAVDGPGNHVLEPAESALTAPSWRNLNGAAQTFSGTASNFTGPGAPNNPTYTILDAAADYGTVPNGAIGSCTATGNCYTFSIGTANPRPLLHWDATFREDLVPAVLGLTPTRVLHVGDSFGDVARSSGYYRFVETILHHGLSGGCGGGNFCPLSSTPREQMSVFVLVAREGPSYQPPACVPGSEMFADVPASSPFCRWIEELARRNLIGGCGGGNFCPLSPVSREQMTVFALATKEGTGYSPPACIAGSERFADVPASSPFCRWIEELERRGIVGGCGGGNFCPLSPVTREQNSVFVTGTFGLTLY
jgi:hypothetical protein